VSEVFKTNKRKPSLLDQLSIVQIICALVLSIGGGAVSVWVTQASTTTKLAGIEKQVDDNRTDGNKQLDDIRSRMITRSDFESLLRSLTEIREDVKDIRAEVLRQAREKR
jgi:hypothetical protein